MVRQARTLYQILRVTRMLPVISSFAVFFAITAVVLVFIEPGITNLVDSTWYLFSSFTTIGYGDFVAKTLLGRALTALLSLNGILVVAMIPAVAITYVSEAYKRNNDKIDCDPILLDQLEHLHRLSHDELKALSAYFTKRRTERDSQQSTD